MNVVHGNQTIEAGAHVMTADGKQIGTVKDVRDDRFKVDVRWAPDYWLGTETVESAAGDSVQLLITKEAIGSAKLHDVNQIDRSDMPSNTIGQ